MRARENDRMIERKREWGISEERNHGYRESGSTEEAEGERGGGSVGGVIVLIAISKRERRERRASPFFLFFP